MSADIFILSVYRATRQKEFNANNNLRSTQRLLQTIDGVRKHGLQTKRNHSTKGEAKDFNIYSGCVSSILKEQTAPLSRLTYQSDIVRFSIAVNRFTLGILDRV